MIETTCKSRMFEADEASTWPLVRHVLASPVSPEEAPSTHAKEQPRTHHDVAIYNQ